MFQQRLPTLIVLCSTVLSSVKISSGKSPLVSIVEGVYFNKLEDVVLYQRSVPLVFVVDLPVLPTPNVNKAECTATSNMCLLATTAEKIQQQLLRDISIYNPYFRKESRSKRGLINLVGTINKYLFGIATQDDIEKLHVENSYISRKQQGLQDALIQEHQYIADVSYNLTVWTAQLAHVYENDLQQIEQALHHYETTNYAGEIVLGRVASLIQQNQHVIRLSSRMESVADNCRNHRIPRSIISEDIIQKKMDRMLSKLEEDGFTYATDLNGLWKLPITDCQFSPSALRVVINVPLKQLNLKYNLYEAVKFPFQYLDTQCVVNDVTDYVAEVGDHIIPISGIHSKNCHPSERKFCFIPVNERDATPFTGCATALFGSKVHEIQEQCVLSCKKTTQVRVSEISPDIVAVTNVRNVVVDCKGKLSNYTVPISVGAVAIRLRCGCTVTIDNKTPLSAPFPCLTSNATDADVVHLIPAQFSSISGLLLQDHGVYDNASEVVDWKWREKFPSIVLNPPKKLQFRGDRFADFETYFSETDNVIYVWCLLLSLILAFLLYCQFVGRCGYNSMSLRKAGLYTFVNLVSVVSAEGEKDEKTLMSMIWSILKMIEIGNLLLIAFITMVSLFSLVVFWRMYRFVRCTYMMTKSMVDDIEMRRR